jgi:uncharacterized surface protein with fasciclin (FAS1) repeats
LLALLVALAPGAIAQLNTADAYDASAPLEPAATTAAMPLPGAAMAADYGAAVAAEPMTTTTAMAATAAAAGFATPPPVAAAAMVAPEEEAAMLPATAAAVAAADPAAALPAAAAALPATSAARPATPAELAPTPVAATEDSLLAPVEPAAAEPAATTTPATAAVAALTPAAAAAAAPALPAEEEAEEEEEASAAPTAAPSSASSSSAGCTTALELVARQFGNLPVHPVFQEILRQPNLKGTFLVPTAKAWDTFFTTMRQRQFNPESAALVARYGQVLLYHLAQNVSVPISKPTPTMPRFAVDTASNLNCGAGVTDNQYVVTKTSRGVYITHGAGNATILSEAIPYCGGEAYLVDQVLLPCSDVSALAGEVVNVQGECRTNVESALVGHKGSLSYFNALMLASGVARRVYPAVREFTIFAPTDDAVQRATESGDFPYAEWFVSDKGALETALAYHVVPQQALARPDAQATRNLETLLQQGGVGNATCPVPGLAWRPDGNVYGGSGAGRVDTATAAQGCLANIFAIDQVLAPCCRPLQDVIGAADGHRGLLADAAAAAKEEGGASSSSAAALYAKALARAKDLFKKNARATVVVPTEAAWAKLLDEQQAGAGAGNKNATQKPLTDAQLDLLMDYLYTRADVTNGAVVGKRELPTGLAASVGEMRGGKIGTARAGSPAAKTLTALCPRGANSTLVFVYEADAAARPRPRPAAVAPTTLTPLLPTAAGAAGAGAAGAAAAGPAPALGPRGAAMIAAMGAVAARPAKPTPPATITGELAGDAEAEGSNKGPAAPKPAAASAGPAAAAGGPAAAGAAAKEPAAPLPGAAPAATPLRRRHLSQAAAGGGLLLPTEFTGSLGGASSGAVVDLFSAGGGGGPPTAPLFVLDGATKQEGLALGGIPVERTVSGCNGQLMFVGTVPLPCNFVRRSEPYAPARAAAALGAGAVKPQSTLIGSAFGLAEGEGPSVSGANATTSGAVGVRMGVGAGFVSVLAAVAAALVAA